MMNPTEIEYEAEQRRHVFGIPESLDVIDKPATGTSKCPVCGYRPMTWLVHDEWIVDCREHGLSAWAERNTVMGLESCHTETTAKLQWNEMVWRYLAAQHVQREAL